jgi:hypothetical protein
MQIAVTVTLEAAPCCGKPVAFTAGSGRVSSSRRECPNCGEWIGFQYEVYHAYAPGESGLAYRKTQDGPERTTLGS